MPRVLPQLQSGAQAIEGNEMTSTLSSTFICGLSLLGMLTQAQTPAPPVVSPQVHSDNRVSFHLQAPNAKEVQVELEGAEPVPMQKDNQGVWTFTTEPLQPDFYGYAFIVDGVRLIDPLNQSMKPNLLDTESQLHVPGPASLSWELNHVAHGTVNHHFYHSSVVGDERDFYVYTPPGYDGRSNKLYPVLYLLHGFSDDASGWTSVGRANVILDNLIAAGKAKPMLIVMPLGYGAPEILKYGFGVFANDELIQRNLDKFREALLTEVIPAVENSYRVNKTPEARAIAGLSMGGGESLYTGLNRLDKFAWIGAFSSGFSPAFSERFETRFPSLDQKSNTRLKLLLIACGTEDRLIAVNRKLRTWLKSKGIRQTEIETPGAHTWMVWRRNLTDFAPLLFR
jgi:enterochelin esterase-like enzyme